MKKTLERIVIFAASSGCDIEARHQTIARPGIFSGLPEGYTDPIFKKILAGMKIPEDRLWSHQAEALDIIDNGMNAALVTATASGKSLPFQLAGLKKILNNPQATVLVFYPTRALNADQKLGWQKAFDAAGLPSEQLGLLDGSVLPGQRLDIIRKARVLLITPDVHHSWVMSSLNEEPVRDFIKNLSLQILDEAHLYRGVLGTNFSYLMRRTRTAQSILNPDFKVESHGQIIAASATVAEPQRFLKTLTGQDFYVVGPDMDGSPRYEKDIVVLTSLPHERTKIAQRLLEILAIENSGTTMAFLDSRMGAEEMAVAVNHKAEKLEKLRSGKSDKSVDAHVLPYRAGYTAFDRREIEARARSGNVKGIVTTSAMEVGIDMPNIDTVILDGIPESIASLQQRAGRVRKEGTVVIVEDRRALKVRGLDPIAMLTQEPEQPILYRGNRRLQAEQALCLLHELQHMGVTGSDAIAQSFRRLPVTWPVGFKDVVSLYLDEDSILPDTLKKAVPVRNIPPHGVHSLRAVHGRTIPIRIFDGKLERMATIGETSDVQAVREAPPGAVILIKTRPYRVKEWLGKDETHSILVRRLTEGEFAQGLRTRQIVGISAHTYLNGLRVKSSGFKKDDSGNFLLTGHLTISHGARGFVEYTAGDRKTRVLYRDPAKANIIKATPEFSSTIVTDEYGPPRRAVLETEGTILRIASLSGKKMNVQNIAVMLRQGLCKAFTISPDDVGVEYHNASVALTPGLTVRGGTIALYDRVAGGSGFSAKLFKNFQAVLNASLEICKDAATLERLILLQDWYQNMKPARVPTFQQWAAAHLPEADADHIQVFLPNSTVFLEHAGGKKPVVIEDVALIEGNIHYKLPLDKNPPSAKKAFMWVSAGQISAPPDRPTWRAGIYDKKAGRIIPSTGPS